MKDKTKKSIIKTNRVFEQDARGKKIELKPINIKIDPPYFDLLDRITNNDLNQISN